MRGTQHVHCYVVLVLSSVCCLAGKESEYEYQSPAVMPWIPVPKSRPVGITLMACSQGRCSNIVLSVDKQTMVSAARIAFTYV